MIDLVYCLISISFFFFFFDISSFYYYINLRSSTVFCFSSGNIYFFRYFFIILICNCLWIIVLWIFLNFCDFISNFITNQITSCFCCFWITFSELFLNASAADCLVWSRSFWLYLLLEILLIFLPIFYLYFSQKTKIHTLLYMFIL